MNFIDQFLERFQLLNFAMDGRSLPQALYLSLQSKNEKPAVQKGPQTDATPSTNGHEAVNPGDLYKIQAMAQQEIIKHQFAENLILRQQQESLTQILKTGALRKEEVPADEEKDKSEKISQKKIKKFNTCGHADKEHYAKGMCNNCYHRFGRNKKPWLCEHEKLYACGLCQNCYINKYNKKRREGEKPESNEL